MAYCPQLRDLLLVVDTWTSSGPSPHQNEGEVR